MIAGYCENMEETEPDTCDTDMTLMMTKTTTMTTTYSLSILLLTLSALVVGSFEAPCSATDAAVHQPFGIVGYYNPTVNGGSWLDVAGTGVGEPMNVGAYLVSL